MSPEGLITWNPQGTGDFAVTLLVDDGRGGTDEQWFTITVAAVAVSELPPDPSTVVPPLDPNIVPTFFEATEFLYTGPNPIQTGVVSGTIEPRRSAVIRGRVLDRNNAPCLVLQ